MADGCSLRDCYRAYLGGPFAWRTLQCCVVCGQVVSYQAVTATVVMIVLLAETIRLYAISLDNTRLYHDLTDREGKIRRLVDANIIGIFIADREAGILEANDAFLRIVGYDREDLV